MDIVNWLTISIQQVSRSTIVQSFLVACIGFVFTVIGILPALIGVKVGNAVMSYGMGFAAGVMISASFVSLLMPSIEIGGIVPATIGFLMGAFSIYCMDKIIPHEHIIKGYEGSEKLRKKLRVVWLLVFAMIIHNIPEGAAIGAIVVESLTSGVVLALAIGIHNIPEGLAVALPLMSTAREKLKLAIGLTILSGAVEPIAAVGAATLIIIIRELLPYMLAFAAGAMIYVVSHEIIPETHEEKREIKATVGLLLGLILMLVLDHYYQ